MRSQSQKEEQNGAILYRVDVWVSFGMFHFLKEIAMGFHVRIATIKKQ